MYCIKCGTHLPDDASFCSACGTRTHDGRDNQADALPLGRLTYKPSTWAHGEDWNEASVGFSDLSVCRVLLSGHDYAMTYKNDMDSVAALLQNIDRNRRELSAHVAERIESRGHSISSWTEILSKIDKILIYKDREHIADVYFGRMIYGKGYKHACVRVNFSMEIVSCSIGSI